MMVYKTNVNKNINSDSNIFLIQLNRAGIKEIKSNKGFHHLSTYTPLDYNTFLRFESIVVTVPLSTFSVFTLYDLHSSRHVHVFPSTYVRVKCAG